MTLGGAKKQGTSMRRKMKRKMNKQRGKADFPPLRKETKTKALTDTPISVFSVEIPRGVYGLRGSRLLPSTSSWGAGDSGRHDCPVCEQGDESKCAVYKVDGKEAIKQKDLANRKGYVGETSRYLYERANKHC